mmetsp:Transcript_42749/g.129909  ORF Transcript_42749/g.129909 Transcript_42749/m.129909 type:complete len:264 (-) Transcript_42749:239-1030(-)
MSSDQGRRGHHHGVTAPNGGVGSAGASLPSHGHRRQPTHPSHHVLPHQAMHHPTSQFPSQNYGHHGPAHMMSEGDPPADGFHDSIFGPDGNILSPKERAEFRRKNGICTHCGHVRTHEQKKAKMRMMKIMKSWTPVTKDGEVYKGHCLKCNGGLVRAKEQLGEAVTDQDRMIDRVWADPIWRGNMVHQGPVVGRLPSNAEDGGAPPAASTLGHSPAGGSSAQGPPLPRNSLPTHREECPAAVGGDNDAGAAAAAAGERALRQQ